MIAQALEVGSVFHRLTFSAAVLPFRHHAWTNRMRALLTVCHRSSPWFAPNGEPHQSYPRRGNLATQL